MAGSHLKGVGAVVGEGHCSGPAVSSGSRSAGGERSALAELCRALPYHSWVLGTDRPLSMSCGFPQTGSSVAGDAGEQPWGLADGTLPFWLVSCPARC